MLLTQTKIIPPGQYESREDSLDIFLTDLAIHTQKSNNPNSLVRSYTKKTKGNNPARAHSRSVQVKGDGVVEVGFGFEEEELLQILQKQGKSMLRVYMPADGLPVYMAQDALEKLESLKKKLVKI